MGPDVGILEDLIAPMSARAFVADHWERRFLHQATPGRVIEQCFSLRDVDGWLAAEAGSLFVGPPRGSEEKVEEYKPGQVSASVAYSAFAKGCSLVLEPLTSWPSLLPLVKALGAFFHATVSVKGLVIPVGARPFPIHAAGQDTFVLQVAGCKRWNLHESRLLQVNPVERKTFKFPLQWYGRTKTPVTDELVVEPGDLLYIPRGTPYQALADQEGTCLFLTINVMPWVWMDFLKLAAEYAALYSEDLRRSLPPGFVGDETLSEGMRETFRAVMKTFEEKVSFEGVLAAAKRNRITRQRFPADGHFAQLATLEQLHQETLLERRVAMPCTVDEVVDVQRRRKSAIFFGSEQVEGPLHLRRAFEFIRDRLQFRVSEIPGLDSAGQIVLARRLVTEGLLRRAETEEQDDAS